jgi:hypothetical protein
LTCLLAPPKMSAADNDIWLQPLGDLEQRFAVIHTPDNVEVWLQETLDCLSNTRMVIGQQDSHFFT